MPGPKEEPGAAITRPRFMGLGGKDTETMSTVQEKKNPRQLAIDLIAYMSGPEVAVSVLRAREELLLDACVEEARGIKRGILTALPPTEVVRLERGPIVCQLVRKEPWQSDRDVRQEELIAGARVESLPEERGGAWGEIGRWLLSMVDATRGENYKAYIHANIRAQVEAAHSESVEFSRGYVAAWTDVANKLEGCGLARGRGKK